MLARLEEHPLRRRGVGVRAEADPGQGDLAAYVVLGHQEVGDADARAILDDQLHRRLLGTHAAHLRDLIEGLAHERLQRRVLERKEQCALGAGAHQQVLPRRIGIAHLRGDAGADGGVLEALRPLVVAAFLDPRWHTGIEPGRAGRVDVHVGGDPRAGLARVLDALDHLVELAPVSLAGDLQVIDLGRRARCLCDADRLIDCLDEVVAFAAHVRDIHAAALPGFSGQRDQLGGLGVGERVVDERGGKSHRAFFHGLVDERAHLGELRIGRLHVVLAQHVDPDRPGADERGDVGRNAALLQLVQVLAERRPVNVVIEVDLVTHRIGLHLCVHRPHRDLAHDLERDTLAQVAQRAAIDQQRLFGMREHVDEAGRDCTAVRIDL